MNNEYHCIVSGVAKYIPPSLLKGKIKKFGSEQIFREHFICPAAAKLLRAGHTVDEVREQFGVTDLPKVKPIILTRLNLMRKKKGSRIRESEEKLERQRYLNSKEFRDKIVKLKSDRESQTYQSWVEENTGIGRERGGTCIRPDIFLTWNDKACDGCTCYKFCLCYNKRMSTDKKRKKLK
jgi:hypothetical protein